MRNEVQQEKLVGERHCQLEQVSKSKTMTPKDSEESFLQLALTTTPRPSGCSALIAANVALIEREIK